MQKIPSVFLRDPNNMRILTTTPNPLADWVLSGEGIATRKYDGTCVMMDQDGRWWARREIKPGKEMPQYFFFVETDNITGKIVGWVPIEYSGFASILVDAEYDYFTCL